MAQDYSFLSDTISMEEFRLQCTLYGIDVEDAVDELKLAEDKGKFCLCLNGKLAWCDYNGDEVKVPDRFNGDFSIAGSKATSLEGCPQVINGDFDCSATDITSLNGAPRVVDGDFDFSDTAVRSFNGAPIKVSGYVVCFGTLTDVESQDAYFDFVCDELLDSATRQKHIDSTGHYKQ